MNRGLLCEDAGSVLEVYAARVLLCGQGGVEGRSFRCGGLEEIDGEDADKGFERVAEAGPRGDEVVGERQEQEGPGEESGGGDASVEGEGEAEECR